jgi:hypothetical protein
MTSPFRHTYLDYAQLTEQLTAWAKAHPDFVRLQSLGKSREGRELWLLVVGAHPDDGRPAVWVDGNMHASELCGTNAALAIAEDAIAIMRGEAPHGLPPHICALLRDTLFYVMPRVSPDGAEMVWKTGRYVRSHPVDTRRDEMRPHWRSHDVDGDGAVRLMRLRDDTGELVESPAVQSMMIPRTLEHAGPAFKVFPEGTIAHFDGHGIPDGFFLGDNSYDFNRNFPWSWKPAPHELGAGDFPGSAPETQAILRFASAQPNIFAWLNFHTFGGVFIRPLGSAPDHKMNQGDLAIYRQVEAWSKEATGYPTVSGYHEFLYEPEKSLNGALTDFAYHQRGAIAYACELWDIFRRIGMDPVKPFVDHYVRLEEKHYTALAAWDKEHNKGRLFRPWTPFKHPQLGDVEIGGIDLRVGISNPPLELIDEVITAQSKAYLRVAALMPRVGMEVTTKAAGGGVTELTVRVKNRGYLATHGLPSAESLPVSEPLRLGVACEGPTLLAPAAPIVEIGHLDGWGRGLFGGMSLFSPWTSGNHSEAKASFALTGKGRVRLTLASCRVGSRTTSVEI